MGLPLIGSKITLFRNCTQDYTRPCRTISSDLDSAFTYFMQCAYMLTDFKMKKNIQSPLELISEALSSLF